MSLDIASRAPTGPQEGSTGATARQLALAVGHLDVAEARDHHLALLLAVADLARSAGREWPWGPDDPTVALLRATARLALLAPDARSEHAAALLGSLASAHEGRGHD